MFETVIKWKTIIPSDRSGITYYDDKELICSKQLLVKYVCEHNNDSIEFTKAVYIPSKKSWQEMDFHLANVIGWYDLTQDLE